MAENQVATGKSVLIGLTILENELAEALGIPVSTVKRLRYEGEIPYVMIGRGRPIYLAWSIVEWLKKKENRDVYAGASGLNELEPSTGPEPSTVSL
jgi:excisionase family DNA binding protein